MHYTRITQDAWLIARRLSISRIAPVQAIDFTCDSAYSKYDWK
jgi:hypothetical protein